MKTITLLGIAVVANPTWLLVFALLIVSLVTSIAGTGPASLPGPLALGVSAIVVLLFLASVVIHELTHALVARRRGVEITEVRLLTLGQPADREPDPVSASTEIIVASAGPLVSGVIGALLLVVALAFPVDTGAPLDLLYWGIYWLGLSNFVLALFLLVPVLPLDGGRIVRAVSWHLSHDLDRATGWASTIGRMFGYAVIGGGLFVAMSVDVFIGIWLIFLGWFAGRLSRSAVDRRRIEQLTAGLTVEDALDREPAMIPLGLTLETLMAQDEQDAGAGVYPVTDGDHVVGIVYLSQARRRFRRDWTKQRLGEVLVPIEVAPGLRPGDPLIRAVERLEATRSDAVPILEPGASMPVAGLVTRRAVMERLRARQALVDRRPRSTPRGLRG